jgi:hypothetical protein
MSRILQQGKQRTLRKFERRDAPGAQCRERPTIQPREGNRVASLEQHFAAELRRGRGAAEAEHQPIISIGELGSERRAPTVQEAQLRESDHDRVDPERLVRQWFNANPVAPMDLVEHRDTVALWPIVGANSDDAGRSSRALGMAGFVHAAPRCSAAVK